MTQTCKKKQNEWLREDEVDAEIAKLKSNPDVRLARAEMRIRYRKRQYLYQLRNLQKRGEELRSNGITEDNLWDVFNDNYGEEEE